MSVLKGRNSRGRGGTCAAWQVAGSTVRAYGLHVTWRNTHQRHEEAPWNSRRSGTAKNAGKAGRATTKATTAAKPRRWSACRAATRKAATPASATPTRTSRKAAEPSFTARTNHGSAGAAGTEADRELERRRTPPRR